MSNTKKQTKNRYFRSFVTKEEEIEGEGFLLLTAEDLIHLKFGPIVRRLKLISIQKTLKNFYDMKASLILKWLKVKEIKYYIINFFSNIKVLYNFEFFK